VGLLGLLYNGAKALGRDTIQGENMVHRVPSANIVANTGGVAHKVLKVQFQKDGSIFAFIPQFARSDGIVARVQLASGLSYPTSIQLPEFGKVTTHIVKFSHHPDGRAHFSQDGKVLTAVKRHAAPLSTQKGHLFTLQVEPLSALPRPRASDRTFTLTVNFVPDTPRALKVVAIRQPASNVRVHGNFDGSSTPVVMEIDGELRQCFVIAPPEGHEFDSHTLILAVTEAPFVSTNSDPSLIFLGGFDDTVVSLDHSKDTEFLAAAYPCSDVTELGCRIGSIDYTPPSTG
jgi:hypothetical protein